MILLHCRMRPDRATHLVPHLLNVDFIVTFFDEMS